MYQEQTWWSISKLKTRMFVLFGRGVDCFPPQKVEIADNKIAINTRNNRTNHWISSLIARWRKTTVFSFTTLSEYKINIIHQNECMWKTYFNFQYEWLSGGWYNIGEAMCEHCKQSSPNITTILKNNWLSKRHFNEGWLILLTSDNKAYHQ
jgi:hypothetical protein